ncbi:carboxypeptidase-like regulatory domain-containing protein [uncultured Winogradskyella sp.]|uniref:carboxypeptidase-like regulatory domain-containing protein n=1 Tax=uncultured Winogradskyella sp. TaxID=395353 RepID=UPI002605E8CC|nr:carboxypeptidase-like regulatory domain-containing protein [uncultured Winogradskyella sp.]
MKSVTSIWRVISICFLLVISCEKNSKPPNENKLKENPEFLTDYLGEKIKRDFTGTLTDSDKNPLENVTITIGNKTSTTAIDGDFYLRNADVNTNFAYIEFKKEGYKDYAISMKPVDSINELTIVLLEESELCLFWFCKHNHNLPNSKN